MNKICNIKNLHINYIHNINNKNHYITTKAEIYHHRYHQRYWFTYKKGCRLKLRAEAVTSLACFFKCVPRIDNTQKTGTGTPRFQKASRSSYTQDLVLSSSSALFSAPILHCPARCHLFGCQSTERAVSSDPPESLFSVTAASSELNQRKIRHSLCKAYCTPYHTCWKHCLKANNFSSFKIIKTTTEVPLHCSILSEVIQKTKCAQEVKKKKKTNQPKQHTNTQRTKNTLVKRFPFLLPLAAYTLIFSHSTGQILQTTTSPLSSSALAGNLPLFLGAMFLSTKKETK